MRGERERREAAARRQRPERVGTLLTRVREYERRTVAAALTPSSEAACEALAPTLSSPPQSAARLIADLSPLW